MSAVIYSGMACNQGLQSYILLSTRSQHSCCLPARLFRADNDIDFFRIYCFIPRFFSFNIRKFTLVCDISTVGFGHISGCPSPNLATSYVISLTVISLGLEIQSDSRADSLRSCLVSYNIPGSNWTPWSYCLKLSENIYTLL